MCSGNAIDNPARLCQFACRQRKPGHKTDAIGFTVFQHIFIRTVGQIVPVLNSSDREYLSGSVNLRDRHLTQPGISDEALIDKGANGLKLLLCGTFGIDPVKLPEVNPLNPQPPKAQTNSLPEIVWVPDLRPLSFRPARTNQTAFRRNGQAPVRRQSLGNQILADERAIAVRGVDEIDTDFR